MRILLTGGAGGVGSHLARALSADHDVVAVDRDSDGLERLPAAVETQTLDLTDPAAVSNELATIDVETIVSAVGWYELAAIEDCSPAKFDDQLAANLTAVHLPIHATLPTVRQRAGQIVVVGSMVGSVALPYHGAYSAAKAGLDGYVDSLRRELGDVDVSLIEPGPIRTGFNERAARSLSEIDDSAYADQYQAFDAYSPASIDVETVVETIVTALESDNPKARYRVGRRARWLPRLQAVLPTPLFDRLVRSGLPGGLLYRLIDR